MNSTPPALLTAFAAFGALAAIAFGALVAVAFDALAVAAFGAFVAVALDTLGALAAVAFDTLLAVAFDTLLAVALEALAAFGAFGALVARGMVNFPYGKGDATIFTVVRVGLPRGGQIRGRRNYQITAIGATIFPCSFFAWCHPCRELLE